MAAQTAALLDAKVNKKYATQTASAHQPIQKGYMKAHALPWLTSNDAFPSPENAWDQDSEVPGLLAAGKDLAVSTLIEAYSIGIFPWFSNGQPILWWSPDPRMTLAMKNFRLHRSLRKTIMRFIAAKECEIRFDTAFFDVIKNCAKVLRPGQNDTWIDPNMIRAYVQLHEEGYAHSIETWINGILVGGLYCVSIGRAIFGESMFAYEANASKIALAAMVGFCRSHEIELVDCQQKTSHLASFGAAEISRSDFLAHIECAVTKPNLAWKFSPDFWDKIVHPYR